MRQQRHGATGLATQHRADARAQFVQVEGLDQIVVGAGIEAGDAVAGAVAGGEHDHRGGVAASAQPAQHVQAVALRQTQVEQHQIEALAGQRALRRGGIAHPVDRMAFHAQRRAQRVADHAVVFHQQEAHRHGSVGLVGSGRESIACMVEHPDGQR